MAQFLNTGPSEVYLPKSSNYRLPKNRSEYKHTTYELELLRNTSENSIFFNKQRLSMKSELFTISKIFTESIYRIPDYQRGYSWKTDQLKDFWMDLDQLTSDQSHYTGVLTLEPVPEETWTHWDDDIWLIKSKRYKPLYIVDGQQRITTTVILLQAIIESTSSSQLNFTNIEDIKRKYIYDPKPNEISGSYLFGYEKDNPSYEFLKKNILLNSSEIHSNDEYTIYTKNLINAKDFFIEALKNKSKEEIEEIYTKVTQQLVFNVYEIADDIDVFVSFETMNNRGKPLSTLELLKNRLIYISTKLPLGEDESESHLRRCINDAWKTTYHYLGKNDDRPLNDDDFLQTHLTYYYPTELKKIPSPGTEEYHSVFRTLSYLQESTNRFLLNDIFTQKRIYSSEVEPQPWPPLSRKFIFDYSQNIKKCIEIYYKLSTPSDSNFSEQEKILLECIGRMNGYNPSSLVMAVYFQEKTIKKRVAFLEKFEKFLFCQNLVFRSGYSNYRARNTSNEIYIRYAAKQVSTSELINYIDELINEITKEFSWSEIIIEWVKNSPSYYGWKTLKYFMFEYDLHLMKKARSKNEKLEWRDFIGKNYREEYATIEHIYPQNARDKYWTSRFSKYTQQQKNALRNSLGNLLPLATPRNSSLSNKAFDEKLGNEQYKVGYKFGCYSENEVALYPEWNSESILERGILLLDFLEERWSIKIGDRDRKIKTLGLDFMK